MLLNTYQTQALKAAIYPKESEVVYPALGLASEAGEVVGAFKKFIRDTPDIPPEEARKIIAKELGDVLWYTAALSRDLGYTLEEVAMMNLDKLDGRMKRGTISGSGDDR